MGKFYIEDYEARTLVENIHEYLAGDPVDDDDWMKMMDNLDVIDGIMKDLLDRYDKGQQS